MNDSNRRVVIVHYVMIAAAVAVIVEHSSLILKISYEGGTMKDSFIIRRILTLHYRHIDVYQSFFQLWILKTRKKNIMEENGVLHSNDNYRTKMLVSTGMTIMVIHRHHHFRPHIFPLLCFMVLI